MSDILLAEITSPDDALDMAHCRNEVREFMTHNTDVITPEQQLEWYRDTYRPAREERSMYGYVVRKDLNPIGYGLVSLRNQVMWVSGGITAAERGSGYGEALFDFLTQKIHQGLGQEEAYLDVRKDNAPAQRLYEKLGYVAVGEVDGLIAMVHIQPQEATQ